MERKPLNTFIGESSKEGSASSDSEKPTSKTKTLRRVPLSAPNTEKAVEPAAPEKPKRDLYEIAQEANSQKTEASEVKPDVAADSSAGEPLPEAEITTEETDHITQKIVTQHLEAIDAADEQTAVDLAPARAYLERVQAGEDNDEAFVGVAVELGLTEDEIAEALNDTNQEVGQIEPDDTPEVTPEESVDAEFEDEDEVDLSSPAPTTPTPPLSGSAGGSGTPPPSPPAPGTPPTPPAPRPAGGGPTGTPSAHMPVAANRAPMPARAVEYYDNRRNKAGQLLLVGLVGYLIGRRRGRIKTEKRLLPVQKKLEKQVTLLEQDITRKEQKLVAAKASLRERQKAQPIAVEKTRQSQVAPTEQRRQPSRAESRLKLEKPARAEQLGHMIVAAETPKVVEKRVFEKPNNIRQAFRAEEVPTMRRAELLELSEKVVVEGANLRQIYETRLIGEKQLRHLVSEYLQGKDIRKDLRREIVEHEIDFERDPLMRDRARSKTVDPQGGGSALGDMLASAGLGADPDDPQVLRQVQKAAAQKAAAEKKQQQRRTVIDTAMVTALIVLAVAVLILALRP